MEDIKTIDGGRKKLCFKLAGSERVWEMPTLDSLPMKKALALSDIDPSSDREAQNAVMALMDELCPGLTDEITLGECKQIFNMLTEVSSVSLGEYQASPEQ